MADNDVGKVTAGLLLAAPSVVGLLTVALSRDVPVGRVADNAEHGLVVVVLESHHCSVRHRGGPFLVNTVPSCHLDPVEVVALVFLTAEGVPGLPSTGLARNPAVGRVHDDQPVAARTVVLVPQHERVAGRVLTVVVDQVVHFTSKKGYLGLKIWSRLNPLQGHREDDLKEPLKNGLDDSLK